MERHRVEVDGRTYEVDVVRRRRNGGGGISIVQPSHDAKGLTRVSLESIRRYTDPPYELWVVDNVSSEETVEFLLAQSDVNLVLNRTPPWGRRRLWALPRPWWRQPGGGSYANGVALELAARFVQTDYMFVMHNDTLACKKGWLGFLRSRLSEEVRAAAVSHDPARVHAMHSSGFLFDFRLFGPLRMGFLPNLPDYDVSDLVSIRLLEAGYRYYVCKNTFNNPETVERIKDGDPLKEMYCMRAFDDDGDIIYLHLGRGTLKTAGRYTRAGKTTVDEWIRYAEEYLLS